MGFEKNLMLIRKKKRISQDDLAFMVGVSRQTIYSWEAGINSPNITMLQRISEVLEVGPDELLNGYGVDRLPNDLGTVSFLFVSNYDGEVLYDEIANWFVRLKVGDNVCFALYDNGVKDYSYSVAVLNEVKLHNQPGFEIGIKEFNKKLEQTDSYSLLAKKEDNKISFIGRIFTENGIKNIETFRDQSFLKNWGVDGKNQGVSTIFDNAKNYVMDYRGKTANVIGIHYFDSEKIYIEVFLNQKFESLFWRRYELNRKSKISMKIDGKEYGLFYEVATSRLNG